MIFKHCVQGGPNLPSLQRSPWQFEDSRSSPRHKTCVTELETRVWRLLQALLRCWRQSWLQEDQGLQRDHVPCSGAEAEKWWTKNLMLDSRSWAWQQDTKKDKSEELFNIIWKVPKKEPKGPIIGMLSSLKLKSCYARTRLLFPYLSQTFSSQFRIQ